MTYRNATLQARINRRGACSCPKKDPGPESRGINSIEVNEGTKALINFSKKPRAWYADTLDGTLEGETN